MSHSPSSQSLPDLVRALRSHRVIFAVVLVLTVLSSVAYSLSQEKSYTAEASLSFKDESLDLTRIGLPVLPTQTATERAASNAQTITGLDVAKQVKNEIDSPLDVTVLSDRITAVVEPSSTLVLLSAVAPTAPGAEELANAFAEEGAKLVNETARDTYAAQADELERTRPPKSDEIGRAAADEAISRLRALSTIAEPAEVALPAREPTSPTTPKTARNVVLGVVLGLVLGLLAALLRDSFDRRMRRSSEIESEIGITLLGHVPRDILGRSARPGSDAKITGPDWELFRILRRLLDFVGTTPTSLLGVTSSMPEEGKTTVASCLAFASAAAGDRTLLIECDLRRPVLAERLELNRAPGLTDFVNGTNTPAEIVQTVSFNYLSGANGSAPSASDGPTAAHPHQLACITAGSLTSDPVEVFRSERFRSMLAAVRDAYDLVILDTPPILVVVDGLELLPATDAIIMCVRSGQATRDEVRGGREALNRLPERPMGLVVTGVDEGSAPGYGNYEYY